MPGLTPKFHPSVAPALAEVRARWPQARLAAFGQTVFWDEPVKSVLMPMLDAHHPDARVLVGAHDADYFGKCPGLSAGEPFVVCGHSDDPATRDLWAAVGEMSALFGAEKVPTRRALAELGVHVDKLLASGDEAERAELLRHGTTAWGWRGVVQPGHSGAVFRDVATADALPAFRELLQWALQETLGQIEDADARGSQAAARWLLDAFDEQAAQPGNAALTDLFQSLWPVFYERLLGHVPKRVRVTGTCELFRFNRRTCRRARFRVLRHFLDPKTAALCRDAYSEAVEGSGMYELERFGANSMPFDLVVPGKGRGTLSLSDEHLVVDTDPHIVIDLPAPVRTADALAAAIEDALGPDVALVGKAVALAFMMTSEFVFVLNEQGSVYVPRTRAMARRMSAGGVEVDLCPVLRIRCHTWDSLSATHVRLRLPEHLAAAFGAEVVSGKHFARRWRAVVRQQERLLDRLARAQSPQDLMELLGHEAHPRWLERLQAYVEAHAKLLQLQRTIDEAKHQADALRDRVKELKTLRGKLQRLRGKMSRMVKPLQSALDSLETDKAPKENIDAAREELVCYRDGELPDLDKRLGAIETEIRQCDARRKQTIAKYRQIETGPEAQQARALVAEVEGDAEAQRLVMAAQAFRVVESLPYTNDRPTAWWLPVVDPEGHWYRAILESAELSVEAMV